MKRPAIIIAATVIVAAAAVVAVQMLLGTQVELGETFSVPDMKLTMRLPAGWSQQQPPEELKRRFQRQGIRYLGHFAGPELGDSCDMIAFDSTQRLFEVRAEILRSEREVPRKMLEDEFTHIPPEGGVPAWVNQYSTGTPPLVMYGARAVLDRGDKKVMISYVLSAPSIKAQHDAILASIRSIRLD